MTGPTIKEQIGWLESELAYMRRKLPLGIRNGNITVPAATAKLAAAEACLRTMTTLRDLYQGKEVASV